MAEAGLIAIEEHFVSPKLRPFRKAPDSPREKKLADMGGARLREMDEAGIDIQVLSENNPAAQNFDAETAPEMARASNDFLYEAIRARPDRFAGLAALPTPNPKAAADELERTVTRLGFKGAMIMGTTQGRFIDEKEFWPIFERAAALDVPVYIHPCPVLKPIHETYFKDYPALAGAPLGFTLETLTHSFRLIMSGVLDKYPSLKIIIGHLGETAPFLLWRTEENLKEFKLDLPKAFGDYYRQHFWLTTSGAFSNSALACAIAEMGIERILYAVDWPYISNIDGTNWLKQLALSEHDRALLAAGNARTLLKL